MTNCVTPAAPPLCAGHLLLVEDDPDLGETSCEFVRDEGYDVVWAVDGAEALEHLRAGHRPALIVTDLLMPRLSGADLLRAIASDRELANIPVLVVSALPQLAASSGVPANLVITKPLDPGDLLVLVSRFCERAGGVTRTMNVVP